MELSFISGELNVQILVHGNLIINIVNLVSEDLHLVQNVGEKGVNHHVGTPFVAEGTKPSLVL